AMARGRPSRVVLALEGALSFRKGVTSCEGDGGNIKPITGESAKQPLTPLRREAAVRSGPVAFLVTRTRNGVRGRGCRGHPAFPAPSFFSFFAAHWFWHHSGEELRRENEGVCRVWLFENRI